MVNAFQKTSTQDTINIFYNGFGGGGWRWGGFGGLGGESTTMVDPFKVGTVVVDMFEPNAKNLIWRGVATDTLSNNPEKNTKNLDGEMHKMFERFPPGSKR